MSARALKAGAEAELVTRSSVAPVSKKNLKAAEDSFRTKAAEARAKKASTKLRQAAHLWEQEFNRDDDGQDG